MTHADRQRLVELIANNAIAAPADVGVKGYFRNLIMGADLPNPFKQQAAEWTTDARINASNLLTFALNKGTNPADPRYAVLGSILQPVLMSESGLEQAATLATIIVTNKLFRDPAELNRLAIRFQIPQPENPGQPIVEYGPDIDWRGVDDIQLQSWLRPETNWLDVGLLVQAVRCATSVCRVEIGLTGERGTGVLIDGDLVLTCYHVLGKSDDAVTKAAPTTRLRFGAFTANGVEAEGQSVELDAVQPVVARSPIETHDFALLRTSRAIYGLKDIAPAAFSVATPAPHSGINILQHPRGDAMKLAPSDNGVTGAYMDTGQLQYVSRTAPGSSGAPCFDDRWRVIGVHHAVRSKYFGVIGEGILMNAIYGQIKDMMIAKPVL